MFETQESIWLGPLRRPVRYLAIGLGLAAAACGVWAGIELQAHEGLNQFKPSVGVASFRWFLIVAGAAVLATAVYLSDTIGAIEPRPTGPMDMISLILSRIAMVGVGFIVVVMFYEVIARYVFGAGTWWANELSLWTAGFVFLLAGLYAMQQRSHIRIYVIYDIMPRWMQKLSDCISVALIWAFALALIWGGYNEAVTKFLRMETFGTAWDPPIPATIKPAILILILMVALQALSNLIADWNKAPEHHSPADEIDEAEIAALKRTIEMGPPAEDKRNG